MEVKLPERVTLCEVGPRDGFQHEDAFIPTAMKVDTIGRLADAGLPRIQVTSFVHPSWVPQMSDAEEVVGSLPEIQGVVYSGLVLNRKGVERAVGAGLPAVDVSIATWDEHSIDNANMPVDAALEEALEMIRLATEEGLEVQIGLQTVFGFREPGDTPVDRITAMVERFTDLGVDSVSLADTTGMANPRLIAAHVDAVRRVTGDIPLVLHLHDTRGLGLANIYEALRHGVDRFDTALGGMGGCPFVAGAAGNVATEDTVYFLESMGIRTGVDIDAVADRSRRMATFLHKDFPGKLYKLSRRGSDEGTR